MFFALPWMLLGLLGLPALVAIYWLRSRARTKTVSSLFLWGDQRRSQQGGKAFQRFQTPLLFFLELLAIFLIVAAAALPALIRSATARPLILVLDDSYSMQAGKTESTRDRALRSVEEEFRRTDYVARVICAGSRPQLQSGVFRSGDSFKEIASQWTCRAPLSDLESALLLAGEVGGETARILVISDQAPQFPLPAHRVEWRSFGKPLKNVAFTAAGRDPASGGTDAQTDRVLLEVTNFGSSPATTELTLTGGGEMGPSSKRIELAPGTASRLILNVPSGSAPLLARLGTDDLAIDDTTVLVSPPRQLLRVQVDLPEGNPLRRELIRALESTGQVLIGEGRPALIISDQVQPSAGTAWQLVIHSRGEASSFDGPFVMDRNHPLTAGLSLDAVIWSAPDEIVPSGIPVITAGNRVLLANQEDSSGRQTLELVLTPELSNLTDSLDWPIFMTNLVRWRLEDQPGPSRSNLQLGQPLRVTFPLDDLSSEPALVTTSDGQSVSLPVAGRSVEWTPEQVGLSQFRRGSMAFPFACNPLNGAESDLSKCESGTWGSWNASDRFQDQRMNLDWALILAALALLAGHMALVSRGGGTGS